jgi:hypothetical protein
LSIDATIKALSRVRLAPTEFVDNQNLGISIDCNGKRQANHHPTGVAFYRPIDEIPNLCERPDGGKASKGSSIGEPKDGGVHINVFATAEFRVESRAYRSSPVTPGSFPQIKTVQNGAFKQSHHAHWLPGQVQAKQACIAAGFSYPSEQIF